MNSASRNKTLLFIIALLLLTNIAMLVYLFWGKEGSNGARKPKGKGIEDQLKTEVGFSDTQLATYKKMREEHWKTAKPMFEAMQHSKDSMFALRREETVPDSTVQAAGASVARQQQAIDVKAFHYFKRLRALCTPDQLPKYDSLIKKVIARKGKPDPNKTNDEKK